MKVSLNCCSGRRPPVAQIFTVLTADFTDLADKKGNPPHPRLYWLGLRQARAALCRRLGVGRVREGRTDSGGCAGLLSPADGRLKICDTAQSWRTATKSALRESR